MEPGPSQKKNIPSEILDSVLRPADSKKSSSKKNENTDAGSGSSKTAEKTRITTPNSKSNSSQNNPSYMPLFSQLQVQTEIPDISSAMEQGGNQGSSSANLCTAVEAQISPSIDISRRNTSSDISLKIKNLQQLVYEKKINSPTATSPSTPFQFPSVQQVGTLGNNQPSTTPSLVTNESDSNSKINKPSLETAVKSNNKLQNVLSRMQLGKVSMISNSESLEKLPTVGEQATSSTKTPLSRTNSLPSTISPFDLGDTILQDLNASVNPKLPTKSASEKTLKQPSASATSKNNRENASTTEIAAKKVRKEGSTSSHQNRSSTKNRKLSLKEYKAKKHHHSSSSNDEGMVLEFTRLPSASSISKTTGSIRSEKSTDNTIIHLPAAKPAIESNKKNSSNRNSAHATSKIPSSEQLASSGDVIGNILGAIQPNQMGRQTSVTPNNQSNIQDNVRVI